MSNPLSVNVGNVSLKSPIILASGTCNFGRELAEYYDLSILGGISSKGLTIKPRAGNPGVRVAECDSGMLNSVGLQNPGIDVFVKRDLPFLEQYDTTVIVNVCGHSEEEYLEVVRRLAQEDRADLLEINISCPNVKEGGIAFGTDPRAVEAITKAVKKEARQPVIMKLSPNVTDISVMARAAENGGADAISLINTLTGMKIDIERQCFAIANRTGGLSGPAIKPVAVRMVYQAAQAVKIPVIGMGGISCAEDAIEFILAGASAVAIGTANFYNPTVSLEVIAGIEDYMRRHQIEEISQLVGAVRDR